MSTHYFDGVAHRDLQFTAINTERLDMALHAPGVFIFARPGPEPVFIGEADNMSSALTSDTNWHVAQARHQANAVYTRRVTDAKQRREELADLIERYQPIMNRPGKAGTDQE